MRASIAASLTFGTIALAAMAAGCTTVRPVEGRVAPLGKSLELQLPATPGYPEKFDATQTIIAQYGERRTALQAVLTLSPDKADVVLTSANGPRILSITWTGKGIYEDRTALAPAELKGVNILADIFMSLWPAASVQAALPEGVTVSETAKGRTIASSGHVIVEIETLEAGAASSRQKLTNKDFGYSLTIITEKTP
jgi:hypothetical protein